MKEEIRRTRFVLSVAAAIITCLLIGCDKPTTRVATATNSAPPGGITRASDEQAALLKDFAPMSEGDKAWQEVVNSMREPSVPAHWETNAPGKEEVAEFEKQTGALAAGVAAKAHDFYTRFPEHANASDAREQ